MPLYTQLITENYQLAIWELTEPEAYFLPDIARFSANPEKLDEIHVAQRRREWLCSRKLAWQMATELSGQCAGVWSDLHNKPHFKNSNLHLSISHAQPYVAVLVHKHHPCGVDIEALKDKLKKLAPKFLSPSELTQTQQNLPALAIAWGAKEAVYKLYGRKQLIFKQHILLTGLSNIQEEGKLQAKLSIYTPPQIITLNYRQFNNHVLVFTT